MSNKQNLKEKEELKCEHCGYSEYGDAKFRLRWKKVLCWQCHCNYDNPSPRVLEWRIYNWKF